MNWPDPRFVQRARAAAMAVPSSRDRVIDAVRGGSLVVVVIGHSAMLIVAWPASGPVVVGNLIATVPGLAVLTWVFQVIPLFFVAGGAASVHSWRAVPDVPGRYAAWLWSRLRRLYRPVLVYLAVMGLVAVVCTLTLGPATFAFLAIACQMLWFLGIYVLTTMLVPVMSAIPRRLAWLPFAVGVIVVSAIDIGVQAGVIPSVIALVDFLVVWLVVQQLGFVWDVASGSARWLLCSVGCLAIAILLVALGPWPVSLVGIPGERLSNMAPPSIVLLLYGLGTGCLLLWLRPRLASWLRRPRPWAIAALISSSSMTIYLWHVPAIGVSLLALRAVGLPPPTTVGPAGAPVPVGALGYLLWWLGYLLLTLVVLAVLIPPLSGLDRRRVAWWDAPVRPRVSAMRTALVTVAGVLIASGTLVLSIVGLAGFPTLVVSWNGLPLNSAVAVAVVVAGLVVARASVRPSGSDERIG